MTSKQAIPQGFEQRTSDIVGTWDAEAGPIYFIPTHASVGDSKTFDKTKPSLLIFGKLTRETALKTKGDEDAETGQLLGQPGDQIGVWAKAGMREIASLCGVEVFMVRDPASDKDVGKGNDMKAYVVASKSTGTMIPIASDRRDRSAGSRTFLDAPASK